MQMLGTPGLRLLVALRCVRIKLPVAQCQWHSGTLAPWHGEVAQWHGVVLK